MDGPIANALDKAHRQESCTGIPQALFPARVQPGVARNKYVVVPDGRRFLFIAPLGREALSPTTVVLNWSAELGR